MMVVEQHVPVLQQDAIRYLIHDPHGIYIDATFGRGGHTRDILDRLSSEGRLVIIDKDPSAIQVARSLYGDDERVLIHQGCFSELESLCRQLGCYGSVDGILFDLGVSSPQLDTPERGFSFRHNGPLDMRMDPTKGTPASEWINQAKPSEITQVLQRYGEEKYSKFIASRIMDQREKAPITTTTQLADIISAAIPKKVQKTKKIHPATKSFQAIRIHVNQEMQALETAMQGSLQVLAPKGRLCVISFHSLEDRIVKRFMRTHANTKLPTKLPVMECDDTRELEIIARKVKPSEQECQSNPRARSAILRIAQKIG